MKILVFGSDGQVGWELIRSCQPLGEAVGVNRSRVDLTDIGALRSLLTTERPQVIVNGAAFTAVDAAESNELLAFAVNSDAVAAMADEAHRLDALLVHFSTDYVFAGTKASPYVPSDEPAPLNVYGRSKLAGEIALRSSGCDYLCLRTSWVYAARGKNFLKTVLRLAAERDELQMVSDQIGAPTSARLIADSAALAISHSIQERQRHEFRSSLLHLTAAGETSWHGFASAILDEAHALAAYRGRLMVKHVDPIRTEDYPLPAPRPRNSRLDCSNFESRFGLRLPHWKVGLKLTMAELA